MRQSRKNPLDSRTRTSMTKSKRFDLKLFSRLFSKNRNPGKLQFTLSPERLSWLFLLWEVKPSPDCKLIKRLTFLFLFLLVKRRLLRFPDKMTLVYARAPLRLFSVFFLLFFENWNQHLIYFYREFLIGVLLFALNNFHRPCWVATDKDGHASLVYCKHNRGSRAERAHHSQTTYLWLPVMRSAMFGTPKLHVV